MKCFAFLVAVAATTVFADEGPLRLSLEQAVAIATHCHPRISGVRFAETAAAGRLDEARLGSLPTGGVSLELNRSTGNTVPGAFFAAPGFVPVAGPTRGRALDSGAWQSGLSAWVSWDALSLLRQAASVDRALAGVDEAVGARDSRMLEIAYATGDAWLQLAAAQASVRVATAAVERADALAAALRPLVAQELRSGAELARLESEAASASTQLARAHQLLELRRVQLAELLGQPDAQVEVDGAEVSLSEPTTVKVQPRQLEADAAAKRAVQDERVVRLEFLPRVELVAALWARGTGFAVAGAPSAGDGLVPDVANWGGGLVATWPLLDLPRIQARSAVAAAQTKVADARREEVSLTVAAELRTAATVLESARAIAKSTPRALEAARNAEAQARARFQAGLTSVSEVAEAQRQLVQAESDDVVARIDVQRALLLRARALGTLEGTLNPLTQEAPTCGSSTQR